MKALDSYFVSFIFINSMLMIPLSFLYSSAIGGCIIPVPAVEDISMGEYTGECTLERLLLSEKMDALRCLFVEILMMPRASCNSRFSCFTSFSNASATLEELRFNAFGDVRDDDVLDL